MRKSRLLTCDKIRRLMGKDMQIDSHVKCGQGQHVCAGTQGNRQRDNVKQTSTDEARLKQ